MKIEKINGLLDKEIEFAKGCGMPQFVMGLQQAKKIINMENERSVAISCSKCGCPLFEDEIMCPDCLTPKRYE